MSSKVIHALYNDDEVVLKAVKKVKAAHHHIEEVFCPFPVHGLDKAMGLAPWFANMPAFVPIMFEMTVFFAAHLMVITFYLRSRIWPFKEAENPDPRTTDDHFLMEIPVGEDEEELTELLKETGAVEIKVVEVEDTHDH